ncbi:hypothetical protein Sjap_014467 [Stephania japonica]|uniref:Uncharacterized protein n=1 Tax=Stephania japonica TaxID=461633 RepID=A0AAP0IHQ6_9MAGN
MMNEKASVTKELNAKHTKILEGLLRLPENRECADCKNKYEGKRWTPKKETQFTPKPDERNANFNLELKGGNSSGHSNNYEESSHVESHARNIAQETPMAVLAGQTVSATPNSRQPSSCADKNNDLDANSSSTDSRSNLFRISYFDIGGKKKNSNHNGFKWITGRKVSPSKCLGSETTKLYFSLNLLGKAHWDTRTDTDLVKRPHMVTMLQES